MSSVNLSPIGDRDLPGRGVPEVEYFLDNGRYLVTDGVYVGQAGPAEVEQIRREGTVQDDGRVTFDYHRGLADSDLVEMPTDRDRCPEPEQRYAAVDTRPRVVRGWGY